MFITRLSEDLLLHILNELGPVDILTVRATCRHLATLTYQRLLWLRSFEKIQQTYGVAEGTFDTPTMTRRDLEAISLRPSRFAQLILKSQKPISPHSVHQIMPSIIALDFDADDLGLGDIDESFFKCILIPGGRFLVTNYGLRLIHLWDLDTLIVDPEALPSPIVTIQPHIRSGSPEVRLTHACVRPDRKALRVVVQICDPLGAVEDDVDVVVYEYFPEHNEEFKEFRRLSLPIPNNIKAFDGRRIAVYGWNLSQSSGIVTIWDVDMNTSFSWKTESCPTSVAIHENLMAIYNLNNQALHLWNIPDSGPHNDADTITLASHPMHPIRELSLSPQAGSIYTEIQSDGNLVVVKRNRADDNNPPSIEILHVSPAHRDGTTPLRTLSIPVENYGFDAHRIPHGFLVNDCWMTVWSEQTVLAHRIYVSAIKPLQSLDEGGPETAENHAEIFLLNGSSPAILECSLCPISQRLAMLDSRGDISITTYL